jgi:NAD(P)-dependent dehydrogenase (short-subunit alcohol dehydrogenase family)
MELTAGQVGVITGGGSGIGLAMARAMAAAGLDLVLADVQDDALEAAAAEIAATGVEVLAVHTDVSKEADVQALAAATIGRFGAVHVVCNNAGVASTTDPWSGPLSAWEWTMGVNFWGIVHGCRTFLPHLLGGGHIVNTSSIAGLFPGFAAQYDASKHAVVAMTESLFHTVRAAGLPVGVSVLCPGWVQSNILEAGRNWPAEYGDVPPLDPAAEVMRAHVGRAIAEGRTAASVADAVVDAIRTDRYWVIPHQDFLDLAIERWHSIAERADPVPPEQTPGLPPRTQIVAEVMAALGLAPPAEA